MFYIYIIVIVAVIYIYKYMYLSIYIFPSPVVGGYFYWGAGENSLGWNTTLMLSFFLICCILSLPILYIPTFVDMSTHTNACMNKYV
jgi:hypothetical protein